MSTEVVLQVAQDAVYTILMVIAPIAGVALAVGLLVSIFQATTQIQEQTLAFMPKIIAVFLTLLLAGPWMLSKVVDLAQRLLGNLTNFVG
jgi:flagellar biosynthetic protein FliQ